MAIIKIDYSNIDHILFDRSIASVGFSFAETTSAPSTTTGFGKLYAKADKKLYYKDSDGVEKEVGSGGGATTFVDLTDVPSTYSGSAGLFLQVSSNESELHFAEVTNTDTLSNTKLGTHALENVLSGSANVAIGIYALQNNDAPDNIGIGTTALQANTSGENNIAIGTNTLAANRTHNNVGIGYSVLSATTTGGNNIGFGYYALKENIYGAYNVALGSESLKLNTTGSNNIAIGYQAGDNITYGSNNILIGAGLDADSATSNNQLNIGGLIKGTLTSGGTISYASHPTFSQDTELVDKKYVVDNFVQSLTSATFSDITLSNLNRNFVTYGADTKTATGIPWSERGKFKVTFSYSAPNAVATISFVGANTSFSYYINGKKFTVTASELSAYTASATASEGTWFFYINNTTTNVASPSISLTKTPWNIYDPDVLLWNAYFNATGNTFEWVGEERHTAGRDIFIHARDHFQGAVYKSGFIPGSQYNGLTTISSNTDNNFGRAMIQIQGGSFFDEDIPNTITHTDASISSTTASPATDWNLNVNQFLGFTAIATTGTNSTTIVFPTSRTLVTGQAVMVMAGNTTTARGTTTISSGGTGTSFTVASLTGLASGDAIVVAARIPIYYISSAAGGSYTWRKLTTTDFLGVISGAAATPTTLPTSNANPCQYNDAVNGGFASVTANRYFPVYLMATNFTSEPVIAILGQGFSTSTTLSSALNETAFQFGNLVGLSGLGIQEAVPFYRLTYHYNTAAAFTNSKMKLVDMTYINVRVATASGTVIGAGVSVVSASSTYTDTTNFNSALSTGDTTVQAALDTIDNTFGMLRNVSASSAPTVNDDITYYKEGAVWIKEDTDDIYINVDNTDGAAVWNKQVKTFTNLTDAPSSYSGMAGKVLQVTSGETGLQFTNGPTVVVTDNFTATTGQTNFVLSNTPPSKDYIVSNIINGVGQQDDAFTLSGSTVTFTEGLTYGSKVRIVSIANVTAVTASTVITEDVFTATTGQTNFTLSYAPGSQDNVNLSVQGVIQSKNAYTLNGTTLTLSSGASYQDTIRVQAIRAVATVEPLNGSVTKAKLNTVIVNATTTSYSALVTQDVILVDTTSNNVTVNLPTAIGNSGCKFIIKLINASNTAIVDAYGSETIDGDTTYTFDTNLDSITIVSNGTSWYIV